MIKAFNIFNSKNNDKYKLKIAGFESNNSSKYVDYLGKITEEEKENLISKSTGLIFLPISEGVGMPPLEALLRDKPVLLSNIPIFNETLPYWKLKADPFNIDEIAQKLDDLANEYFDDMISENKSYILNMYSWEKVVSKYLSIIKSLL